MLHAEMVYGIWLTAMAKFGWFAFDDFGVEGAEPTQTWVSPQYFGEAHHEHSFNDHLPLFLPHLFPSTPFQL